MQHRNRRSIRRIKCHLNTKSTFLRKLYIYMFRCNDMIANLLFYKFIEDFEFECSILYDFGVAQTHIIPFNLLYNQ